MSAPKPIRPTSPMPNAIGTPKKSSAKSTTKPSKATPIRLGPGPRESRPCVAESQVNQRADREREHREHEVGERPEPYAEVGGAFLDVGHASGFDPDAPGSGRNEGQADQRDEGGFRMTQ